MADKFDDDMLNDLFAAAKADARHAPSPEFMARVLADAEMVQAELVPSAAMGSAAATQKNGLWRAVLSAVGGWGALSGVAMAGVAGVWIGVSSGTALMTNTLGLDLYGETAQTYLSELDVSYAFELGAED